LACTSTFLKVAKSSTFDNSGCWCPVQPICHASYGSTSWGH